MRHRPTRPRRATHSGQTSSARRLRMLQKDLEGMYRLQSLQLTLIRNLQRELEELCGALALETR